MSWPSSVTVEVDFTNDPNDPADPTPDWEDIASYVTEFSTDRGRSDEIADVEQGTASLALNNVDGRFDPTNTGSPYSPGVKPMRESRIRATYGATTYDVFSGFVREWPLAWEDQGLRGVSSASCEDAYRALEDVTLRPVLDHEVLALDGLLGYWTFAESQDADVALDLTEQKAPLAKVTGHEGPGEFAFGAESPMPGGTGGGVSFLVPVGGGLREGTALSTFLPHATDALSPGPSGAGVGSGVGIWFTTTGSTVESPIFGYLFAQAPSGPPTAGNQVKSQIIVQTVVDSTDPDFGKVVGGAIDWADSSTSAVTSTSRVDDGELHFVYVELDSTGKTAKMSVDGAAKVTAGTSVTHEVLAQDGSYWTVGGAARTQGDSILQGFYFSGTIARTFMRNGTLTNAEIASLYDAGLTRFAGDSTDERITRILTWAGWNGTTALATGDSTLGPADSVIGQSALQAIQDAAQSEGGVVYVDGAGAVTFLNRQAAYNRTSLVTFGEDEAAGEIPYEGDITFPWDTTYVFNDIRVTRDGGVTVTRTSAASQDTYFPKTLEKTLLVEDDLEAIDAADYYAAVYADPQLRCSQLTVKPSRYTGTLADTAWACLGLDIGDPVTATRRATGHTVTGQFVVQRIQHQVTQKDWQTTFTLSPAPPFVFEQLDVAAFSALDSMRLAY